MVVVLVAAVLAGEVQRMGWEAFLENTESMEVRTATEEGEDGVVAAEEATGETEVDSVGAAVKAEH